ncbi:GntR family transcriptional regulator [Paraburkholderia sp.]|uniref:GntR family transcriptional regulator n=1 Tax=Paraburkholderia sp. TaxID=1926495 RepID=UPI00239C0220|nr:GntR family transcriptional regulator [Paraburkholderia sp.]MDE1183558.1 GntR family transcriptional regulator [Paraburkholderia sp.]
MTLSQTSRSPGAVRPNTASLADQAYEFVKREIITMRLRPGEALNEAELMTLTGIGRTPVHQALHRLVHEGMLTIMPRKGVMVRPVSLDDVLAIIEVRLINESYCVELAARHAQPHDFATMEALLERSAACVATHDVERMMEIDRDFHLAISTASRNAVLAEILRGLHERSLRFWFISLSEPHHLEDVHDEHLDLFRLLRERDADGARQSVQRHIEAFRATLFNRI